LEVHRFGRSDQRNPASQDPGKPPRSSKVI
jgi:hypothetical protein